MVPQVPVADNYYAALNAAVFSDGSFVFIPKGVKSPMEISTYFRINASETGQVSLPSPLRLLSSCWVHICTCRPRGVGTGHVYFTQELFLIHCHNFLSLSR